MPAWHIQMNRLIYPFNINAGAPLEISDDLVTTFNISMVVRGTISETNVDPKEQQAQEKRYQSPKEANIFRYIWLDPSVLSI